MVEGTGGCLAPLLDWGKAPQHPHNVARKTFIKVDGVVQPAPQFSPTAAKVSGAAVEKSTDQMLESWGVSSQTLQALATPACTGAG